MSSRADSWNRTGVIATMVLLSWGAFAFGGNYRWAYWPMIVVAAIIGMVGLVRRDEGGRLPVAVTMSLLILLAAGLLQVVPLPGALLDVLNPGADQLLRKLWLSYALEDARVHRHALSIAPQQTLTALAFLLSYGLLMLATSRLTRRALRSLVAGVIGLGVVLALVGIVQKPFFTGKIYGFWDPIMRGSSFGPFINQNHFAGWTIMALPLTIAFAIASGRRRRYTESAMRARLLWWTTPEAAPAMLSAFAAGLMGIALLLTSSRSGRLSGIAAIVLLGWIGLNRRNRRGMAAVAILALVVVLWAGVDKLTDRFTDSSIWTLSGRLSIWHQTMAIVREFPLTGIGLNTYSVAMVVYQTIPGEGHLSAAHSDYLQLVAEGGWLLMLPVGCAIGCFAHEVWRRFEPERSGPWNLIRLGPVYVFVRGCYSRARSF